MPAFAFRSLHWPEGAAMLEEVCALSLEMAALGPAKRRAVVGEAESHLRRDKGEERTWAIRATSESVLGDGASASAHQRLHHSATHQRIADTLDRLAREGGDLPGLLPHGLVPLIRNDMISGYTDGTDPDLRGRLALFDASVDAETYGGLPSTFSAQTAAPSGPLVFGFETVVPDPTRRTLGVQGQRFLDMIDLLCTHAPAPDAPWWVLARKGGDTTSHDRLARGHFVEAWGTTVQANDAAGALAIGPLLGPDRTHLLENDDTFFAFAHPQPTPRGVARLRPPFSPRLRPQPT